MSIVSRVVEASAPCRVDLAGGPGTLRVEVAIDRRPWCRVETGIEGVQLESKDALLKASGRDVSEVLEKGSLTLAARVLRACGVETGIRVVTHSRVPDGAGLGASSALALAIAAAVARATGQELDPGAIGPVAPDYHAALYGGLLALHPEGGRVRAERLAVDPARVEESLLLVDAGGTGTPPTESHGHGREAPTSRADVPSRVREALLAGRFDEIVELLAAEGPAPGMLMAEFDRIGETARAAGGAMRVCGAGLGRVVAVWAPPGARSPGRREAVAAALKAAGVRAFPARVDLRGLEVD